MEKKKMKIEIAPSKVGSFTAWCKRRGYNGVTSECINEGKRSKLAKIRKKAVFADNAKNKWNHK